MHHGSWRNGGELSHSCLHSRISPGGRKGRSKALGTKQLRASSAPSTRVHQRAGLFLRPTLSEEAQFLEKTIWNFALSNFGLSETPQNASAVGEAVLILRTFLGQTELVKTRGRY